jgi:hypothetical protein
MSEEKAMDPQRVVCVVMHNGKEVGRVRAAAPHAERYITGLVEHYHSLQVEYVEVSSDVISTMMLVEPRL